jgi:valyl-tRNA synthetase
MSLSVCSRTGDIVEPMIKPQWLVNCNTMAKASLDVVRSKKIEIIPQQYEQDWYRYIYSFLYALVDLCCPFQSMFLSRCGELSRQSTDKSI